MAGLAVEVLNGVVTAVVTAPTLRRTQCGASVTDQSVHGWVSVVEVGACYSWARKATGIDSLLAASAAFQLPIRHYGGRRRARRWLLAERPFGDNPGNPPVSAGEVPVD